MKENNFLVFILSNRDLIKEKMPTSRESRIIEYCKRREKITCTDISIVFGMSIQSTAKVMKSIFNKGYLTREDVGDPTGGSMYEYKYNL